MNLLRASDWLATLPAALVWIAALAMVALIGLVDYWTSHELSTSIFYLLPVSVVAWGLGRGPGALFALVAALVWLGSDLLEGHVYSNSVIPIWDAAVRFGFFLVVSTLLTRLHEELCRQRNRADHDALTGLLAAAAFYSRAEAIIRLLERHGRPAALGFIDLDGFKKINDTLGHAEGDRLLANVAGRIRDSMRESDLAGRLGGDEFALLMADAGPEGAREVFSRIEAALERLSADYQGRIGFSAGVVCFQGGVLLREVLHDADALMYEAKHAGRGRVLIEQWRGTEVTSSVGAQ